MVSRISRSCATRTRSCSPELLDGVCRRPQRLRLNWEHREELLHLVALAWRHVLEVAAAIDDLPELLRLDTPELLADQLEPVAILAGLPEEWEQNGGSAEIACALLKPLDTDQIRALASAVAPLGLLLSAPPDSCPSAASA